MSDKAFKLEMVIVCALILVFATIAATPVWKSLSYDSANGNVVPTFINLTRGAQMYGTNLAVDTDARFTDARTPTAHKTSHRTGGTDAMTAADIGADTAGTAAGLVANKLDTDSVISSPTATVTYASDSLRIDVVKGGTVTSVTATSPLSSTGGADPVISMAADSVSEIANAYANWARIDRCGWVTQPSIQFDADTRTITMSGAATYHQAGVLKTMTNPTTSQIASAAGTYYFYMDSATTVDSATAAWSLLDSKIPAALVIYNSANTPKYLLEDERHTSLWDRRMHWYEHSTSGTELVSGGALSGYQTGSSATTNAHNDFGIASALIADEDLPHTLAALTDPAGSGSANYIVMYRDGGTGYTWKQTALPYSVTGTYIDYDTGTGTLVEGAANKAYNYYLAYTNIQGKGRHILIPGRNVYANAAAAYAEDVRAFDFTGFPVQEIVIVYQITWETASGYGQTGKCRMSRAPVKISTSVTQVNAASQASNHNALSGLQGGSGTDYYHVSAAQAAQGSLVGGTGFTLTTAADSTRIDYSPTTSSCQTDTTFTSAFLSSGILTFNHNLSSQNVAVEIWDDKYSKIANADSQTNWSENQVRLDLSSFVATSKLTPSTTWRIRALKGGTSTGGGGSATTDASLLTSGTLDSARLPDITTAGTYTNATVTVDAKGRISTASSGSKAYAHIVRTSNYSVGAQNTWYDLALDTNVETTGITHSTTSNTERIYVDSAGTYLIAVRIAGKRSGAAHHNVARLYKNGTSEVGGSFVMHALESSDSNEIQYLVITSVATLAANDYVTVQFGSSYVGVCIDVYDDATLPNPTKTTYIAATIIQVQ